MRKNRGIMILLLFSMLLAPSRRVSRVPTTTTAWKGTTEYPAREKLSNQAAGSAVISVPVRESVRALST